MIASAHIPRPFVAGSSGWTASELDQPRIARLWDEANFELIDGVLTNMPPAYYDGQKRLRRLIDVVEEHLKNVGRGDERFAFEIDIILSDLRVPKADAVLLTPQDERRQREANKRRGRLKLTYGRILVPPTLLIESISIGHERHDEVLKRAWYAKAGIPNYWLFNPFRKSLTCLVLDGKEYRVDQAGKGNAKLRPSLFAGLIIPLAQIWRE